MERKRRDFPPGSWPFYSWHRGAARWGRAQSDRWPEASGLGGTGGHAGLCHLAEQRHT
jgi:hypothetical protein